MSRTPIETNLKTPLNAGCGYLVKDRQSNKLYQCSTVAHRDLMLHKRLGHMRQLSSDKPWFYIKIGAHLSRIKFLKVFCGADRAKPITEDGRFEFLNIPVKKAVKMKLRFVKPGLLKNFDVLKDILRGYKDVEGKIKTNSPQEHISPSRDIKPKMKVIKSHKKLGRPLGSKNKVKHIQEVPAPAVSEITMTKEPATQVSTSPGLSIAEGPHSSLAVSEITLTLKKGATVGELQADFDAAVKKLAETETQPVSP